MAYLTPEQLQHLKDNQELFDEHQSEEGASIEEYFHDHSDEDGPGTMYLYLCADLGLTPVGQPRVVWELDLNDARELWEYLHHNRPGGHQAVHDSLLEAIEEASHG